MLGEITYLQLQANNAETVDGQFRSPHSSFKQIKPLNAFNVFLVIKLIQKDTTDTKDLQVAEVSYLWMITLGELKGKRKLEIT